MILHATTTCRIGNSRISRLTGNAAAIADATTPRVVCFGKRSGQTRHVRAIGDRRFTVAIVLFGANQTQTARQITVMVTPLTLSRHRVAILTVRVALFGQFDRR